MEQGKTLEKLSERDEASGCYINAAKSYKKEFPKGLIDQNTYFSNTNYMLLCRLRYNMNIWVKVEESSLHSL